MPTQVMNDSNSNRPEIKVKTAYNGEVMITYINDKISYDELSAEIRGICRFLPDQVSFFLLFVFVLLSRSVSFSTVTHTKCYTIQYNMHKPHFHYS